MRPIDLITAASLAATRRAQRLAAGATGPDPIEPAPEPATPDLFNPIPEPADLADPDPDTLDLSDD